LQGIATWIAGGVVGLIGVFGLFLAANAGDRGIHVFGLGLAAFAVIYVSAQMKQSFDARDRSAKAAGSQIGMAEQGSIGRVTQ